MSIIQFLPQEAIVLQLQAASSEHVIRVLGERLRQLNLVKAGFVEATLRREADRLLPPRQVGTHGKE